MFESDLFAIENFIINKPNLLLLTQKNKTKTCNQYFASISNNKHVSFFLMLNKKVTVQFGSFHLYIVKTCLTFQLLIEYLQRFVASIHSHSDYAGVKSYP